MKTETVFVCTCAVTDCAGACAVLLQIYLQKQLELGLEKFAEKYGLVPIAGVETDGEFSSFSSMFKTCLLIVGQMFGKWVVEQDFFLCRREKVGRGCDEKSFPIEVGRLRQNCEMGLYVFSL